MFKPMLLSAVALFVVANGVLFSASWQENRPQQNDNADKVQSGSAQAAKHDTTSPPMPATVDAVVYQQTVSKAVDYLLNQGQDKTDGSFSKSLGPAVTAMCTTALLKHGVPIQNSAVQKSLKYLEGFIQADGGVYPPGSNLRNYETSVAVMCFIQANADGQYDKTIEQAVGFLKNLQWDDGEGHPQTSAYYGGQGYGSHQRPDASNTSFFLDALKAAGEDPNSAAIQKALKFMSRCQNLQSPENGEPFVQNVNSDDRGGSIYTPVGGGESKAGARDKGGLRSYASMTYAGLKSFLYAGVKKDDIRVKAAMDWISRHYDLKTNPGMGGQGLFYYYHVFAKALDANGEARITDANNVQHNWRAELLLQLNDIQRQDGSWTNEADRWYEGDPNLVTSYALLALSYCHPDKDNSPKQAPAK